MLVLQRKIGQEIEVQHEGEILKVRILEARGEAVRLGLEGPKSFVITRTELLEPAKEIEHGQE